MGAAEYPEGILEAIRAKGVDVISADAIELATQAGSSKAANVVLIGMLSNLMPFSESEWKAVIDRTVPPKFLEINEKAFALGRAIAAR